MHCSWQITNILDLPCAGNLTKCNSTLMNDVHQYADYYLTIVAPVVKVYLLRLMRRTYINFQF